jgi:ParB family chromosome partitioning protein
MSARSKRPSPVLGAASAMIDEATETLVTKASRFRHSFEADVSMIEADPTQPRKTFTDKEIASLAATMEERGQLQPILLRPKGPARGRWLIVAGERRWRAAKLNGWPTILAIEHDGDPEVATLLENLQRVDLTPVEEARGLQHLIEGKGWTQDQAAGALGKSKSEVSGILRILTLPDDVLAAVLTSELAIPKHALVELARVERVEAKQRLIQLAKDGQLTVRMIRSVRDGIALPEPSSAEKSDGGGARRPRPPGSGFNFREIGKVTNRLREARAAGQALVAKDRAYLEELRAEIDEFLGGHVGEK